MSIERDFCQQPSVVSLEFWSIVLTDHKVPGSGLLPWKTRREIRGVWGRKSHKLISQHESEELCRWMFGLFMLARSPLSWSPIAKTIEPHCLPDWSPTDSIVCGIPPILSFEVRPPCASISLLARTDSTSWHCYAAMPCSHLEVGEDGTLSMRTFLVGACTRGILVSRPQRGLRMAASIRTSKRLPSSFEARACSGTARSGRLRHILESCPHSGLEHSTQARRMYQTLYTWWHCEGNSYHQAFRQTTR